MPYIRLFHSRIATKKLSLYFSKRCARLDQINRFNARGECFEIPERLYAIMDCKQTGVGVVAP